MTRPLFVGAGSGVALTTGTGTVSKTGCTAGNLLVIHLVVRGITGDWSAFSNEVNVQELNGTLGNIQGIQTNLGVGATSEHSLFCCRVTADGTCSGDFTVGASGEDMYARMYEFSGEFPGSTVAQVFANDTATYDALSGTGTTVTATDTSPNDIDALALQFVAVAANEALSSFSGEVGLNWVEAVAEYATSTGAAASLQLQTADVYGVQSVSGGTLTLGASAAWGTIGTTIVPAPVPYGLALTDDFNRADSATLGLSWLEGAGGWGSGLEIVSNAVRNVDGVAEDTAVWTAVAGSDISTAFTIKTLSAVDYDPFPFFVREDSTVQGIQLYLRNPRNAIEVWRGVTQDITINLGATFVVGDAICARAVDNNDAGETKVYVYRQAGSTGPWVEVGRGTLNAQVQGPYFPGLGIYNNTTTLLDNFQTGRGSPVRSYFDEVMADNPRGYWRMDDLRGDPIESTSLTDSSGYGNDLFVASYNGQYRQPGLISSDPTSTSVLFFYTWFSSGTAPELALGDVYTLEAWVKLNGLSESPFLKTVMDKGSTAYRMSINAANEMVLSRYGSAIATSTKALTVGAKTHCVITKNGPTVKLYLDAVDVTGTVTNLTCADTTQVFYIGATVDDTEINLAGWVDEVAVYATALPYARVQAHYTASFVPPGFVLARRRSRSTSW